MQADSTSNPTQTGEGSAGLNANQPHSLVLVEGSGLVSRKTRPPLPEYLRKLWRNRFFIREYTKSTSFGTGRGTFLGKAWLILDPILQVAVYALVFGLILRTSRGIENFIGFLVIGVLFFQVMTRGLTNGSGLIRQSRSMISSFGFPRASIPLAAGYRNFLESLIPCSIGIVVALLFQYSKPLSWTIILVVPIYILMLIFATGLTFFSARITAFIPDMKSVISVFVRGLFFVSGIFFSIERFDHNPAIQQVMLVNPFYQFLSAARSCVLSGEVPSAGTWIYITVWAVGAFALGLVFFWRKEVKYAHVK